MNGIIRAGTSASIKHKTLVEHISTNAVATFYILSLLVLACSEDRCRTPSHRSGPGRSVSDKQCPVSRFHLIRLLLPHIMLLKVHIVHSCSAL